jgi:hypothetical protein
MRESMRVQSRIGRLTDPCRSFVTERLRQIRIKLTGAEFESIAEAIADPADWGLMWRGYMGGAAVPSDHLFTGTK